jgi:hypothetical protein
MRRGTNMAPLATRDDTTSPAAAPARWDGAGSSGCVAGAAQRLADVRRCFSDHPAIRYYLPLRERPEAEP